jgi:hypothetical protein
MYLVVSSPWMLNIQCPYSGKANELLGFSFYNYYDKIYYVFQ